MPATRARAVEQVFALTETATATYSNPTGAFTPMPATSLVVTLRFASMVTITFCARGAVASSSGATPIVFIRCEIDGQPCEPDTNPVGFLYPQFCCDTRSFTWVVPRVSRGRHAIDILWGMGNPTSASVSNRTLIVQAARL